MPRSDRSHITECDAVWDGLMPWWGLILESKQTSMNSASMRHEKFDTNSSWQNMSYSSFIWIGTTNNFFPDVNLAPELWIG